MPNTKGPPISIPDRGDPNRKRVLGVLAQRRYRDRIRLQGSTKKRRTDPALNKQVEAAPQTLMLSDIATTPSLGAEMRNLTSTAWEPTPAASIEADFLFQVEFDTSDELQLLETSCFSFPDDRALEVPYLKVMRAGLMVGNALKCIDGFYDLAFTHLLDINVVESSLLPSNFHPTDAQLIIPHHPLFDVLPWPAVRQRLIHVFASPLDLRPPIARDPLAISYMVYDIDDCHEGFRVEGEDGLNEAAWIVGQKFFSNWWWALDRSIVDRSNAWRLSRGQQRLSVAAPSLNS